MARLQGDWKDLIRQQRAELEQLEAIDSELNDDKITADIDKALKKTSRVGAYSTAGMRETRISIMPDDNADYQHDDNDDDGNVQYQRRTSGASSSRATSAPSAGRRDAASSRTSPGNLDAGRSPMSARGTTPLRRGDPVMDVMDDGGVDGAPDMAARYQKARLKMLSKHLEDSVEMRKQLTETVNDLQKQLRNEREESKKNRKRVQLLESDAKRNSGRRTAEVGGVDTVETLAQEVTSLRKDVQTAERIAKQSETIAKAKETHLKRALETIARLKTQVSEFQDHAEDSNQGERGKIEAAESRVKLLERQRADLMAAFKKQMKLVDVLKRQKVHIEAARLLAFTEDEFVRTLDWGV